MRAKRIADEDIMEFLARRGMVTCQGIAKHFGYTWAGMSHRLDRLAYKKVLEKVITKGESPQCKKFYRLASIDPYDSIRPVSEQADEKVYETFLGKGEPEGPAKVSIPSLTSAGLEELERELFSSVDIETVKLLVMLTWMHIKAGRRGTALMFWDLAKDMMDLVSLEGGNGSIDQKAD